MAHVQLCAGMVKFIKQKKSDRRTNLLVNYLEENEAVHLLTKHKPINTIKGGQNDYDTKDHTGSQASLQRSTPTLNEK